MALAHQMYPQRTKYFLEAYTAATARPHGYLVIDMTQETPDILRLRSRIFPGEEQKAYADINPPFCKIAFFFMKETDFSVSALNPALFLVSFSLCGLVNGTFPLKCYRHTHTDSRRDCDRLWLWGVYEYTVSSFISILYHWRTFSSAKRPCYSLSIWCKSDKKRDVTRMASLFTEKSHHRNIIVMYIVQNLFHRGKHHRVISLNAHYMVLFRNPRDVSQIMGVYYITGVLFQALRDHVIPSASDARVTRNGM
jgi:hypothetical protein